MNANRDGFVPLGDVLRELGCRRSTLNRRMHRDGISAYVDPFDNRRRLIVARDAAELLTPRRAGGMTVTAA